MNKHWQDVALDAGLALFWFASGYFMMSAFGVPRWALYAALMNVILGMSLILLGTTTPSGWEQLYRAKKDENRGINLPLVLVIMLPPLCILIGVMAWILRLLANFNGYK